MKKIEKILAVCVLVVLFSCDEALDTILSNAVEVENAIVDVDGLEVAVIGSYNRYATADLYNRTFIVVPALLSDNCYLDPFDNRGRFVEYDNYNVNINDPRAGGTWEDLNRSIAETSVVLREAAKLDVPESQQADADQFIGEVYALRALAYLKLQELFAQPYNFTSDQSHLGAMIPDFDLIGLEVLTPSRGTTGEVFDLIVSDLQMAISLMGEKSSPFRMDVTAAKALLARAYLYMENWGEAERLATEVIAEFDGDLLGPNDYIGSWSSDQSSESIFTLFNTQDDNSGVADASFFFLGDFEGFATPDFIDIFSGTDVRLGLYDFDSGLNQYLVRKYPTTNGTDNKDVVRLSEIYLIKAEAHARLNENAEALETLNLVVTIRDIDADEVLLGGQALIDRILLERRKELAFEGYRLLDLTRTGATFTKFRIALPDLTIDAPDEFTIMPIPLREFNVNPGVEGQQNPGY